MHLYKLKGRELTEGKESKKKTSPRSYGENLYELLLNSTWVNNENFYCIFETHILSILPKCTSIHFVIIHGVIIFDLRFLKAVPYK